MGTHTKLTLFLIIIGLIACKSNKNTKEEFAGTYDMQVKFEKNLIDKLAIQDSIKTALAEAEKEITNAKVEIKEDLDGSKIDTTTPEGKMEFAAKKFGEGMSEMGNSLGTMAKGMAEMAGNMAEGGIELADNLLKNLKVRVELLEDGSVKGSSLNFSGVRMDDATWDVRDKKFYLKSNKDSSEEEFKITKVTDTGFELEKDKATLVFTRVK
jgi:hypothetical protein